MNLSSFVVILVSPLLMLAVHALLSRVFLRKFNRQLTAILAGLAGGLLSSSLAFALLDATLPTLSTVFCIFFFPLLLGHIYFHVFNMSETARRIKILISALRGTHGTPDDEYAPTKLIEIRVERLLATGQVAELSGRLYSRAGILKQTALAMEAYRRLLFRI